MNAPAEQLIANPNPDIAIKAKQIQKQIADLQALGDEDLKGAMDDLKKALMQNPAACALMLPQDVGAMVTALRRITGEAVLKEKKTTKPKAGKMLTQEEIEQIDDF